MYSNPNIIEVHFRYGPFDSRLKVGTFPEQYGEGIEILREAGFQGQDNLVIMYGEDYRRNRHANPLVGDSYLEVNNRGTIKPETIDYLLKGDQFEMGSRENNIFIIGRYWDGCVTRAFESICSYVRNNGEQLMHINVHFVMPLIDTIPTGLERHLITARRIFFAQEYSSFSHAVFLDGKRLNWKEAVGENLDGYRHDMLEAPPNLSTINIHFWSDIATAKRVIVSEEI